jgi:signal transduction histidine kinase
MVVTLLFSVLLGFWIGKVIEQSRQRADLIAQLERTRRELAQAHHAQGVTAERERMAREIHDTLAQGFTSIITLAQAAQAGLERSLSRLGPDVLPAARRDLDRLTVVEDVARENLAEARALVAAFTPVDLDGATLPDALRRLADRFAERTGTAITVDVAGPASALDRDQEVVLLRAVQEALANVRQHAAAASVTVRLVAVGDVARVEVTDDGIGFSASRAEGFGLSGMRARVGEAGGRLSVDSASGRGTHLVVEVPAGRPWEEP